MPKQRVLINSKYPAKIIVGHKTVLMTDLRPPNSKDNPIPS